MPSYQLRDAMLLGGLHGKGFSNASYTFPENVEALPFDLSLLRHSLIVVARLGTIF
jgi:hypothetical protein